MTERPTPETDAMLHADWNRLEEYSAPLSAYRRMTALCRTLERERDEARAIAKYWQEQYGHSNPEHHWQALPWDKEGGPQ